MLEPEKRQRMSRKIVLREHIPASFPREMNQEKAIQQPLVLLLDFL
jgi:hypothetical protein